MANNRMTEGVGKKIVEALKMQNNDMDIAPINTDFSMEEPVIDDTPTDDFNFDEHDLAEETTAEDSFESEVDDSNNFASSSLFEEQPQVIETPIMPQNNFSAQPTFNNTAFETPVMPQASIQNIEEFEVPSNVAVLKQLISKLPAGVTKQTGALIIKQTMEALGISMKSVLQEAQQVQEGLNNSTRECQASIAEYKRQIGVLEKQAQKYQRQYAALNDIISLFVQTNF